MDNKNKWWGDDLEVVRCVVERTSMHMGIPLEHMPFWRAAEIIDEEDPSAQPILSVDIALRPDFRDSLCIDTSQGEDPFEVALLQGMRSIIWTYGAAIEREQSDIDINGKFPPWCFAAHPILKDLITRRDQIPSIPATANLTIEDLIPVFWKNEAMVGPISITNLHNTLKSLILEGHHPVPESALLALQGKPLGDLVSWPLPCEDVIVTNAWSEDTANDSRHFTLVLAPVPFVRLGEPPSGIHPDPGSNWQRCYLEDLPDSIIHRKW